MKQLQAGSSETKIQRVRVPARRSKDDLPEKDRGAIMRPFSSLSPYLQELADGHRNWLRHFDGQYLCNWEKVFKSDIEAAMCEASVTQLLQDFGVCVEPNEDLIGSSQRPDFRCSVRAYSFYVEATCIQIKTATKRTKIAHDRSGAGTFRPLNKAAFAKCTDKASQLGDLNAPALLAIGTFHTFAAMVTFEKFFLSQLLTGETMLAYNIDTRTGEQVGSDYLTSNFDSAAFLKPDKEEGVGFARNSISGLLLCNLGIRPIKVVGVLHPNPVRPFDPAVLPKVEFGRGEIDRDSGQVRVTWPGRGAD